MTSSLTLKLNGQCIETCAKKELNRMMDDYFTIDDTEGMLDENIEMLREFVETTNFEKLKKSDARLNGNDNSSVKLSRDKNGKINLEVQTT